MGRLTISYGGSVRGPGHTQKGVLNEDAWLRAEGKYGALIVVCDGLGSRPQARLGARTACVAVREAVGKWSQAKDAPISYLVHLIEVLWRIRIHPCKPADAATTCLLALARPDGEWVVGGIGDGLVMVKTGEEPAARHLGDRGDDFGNETTALGISAKAWKLSILEPTIMERMAILATDGVADDLVPGKIDDFCKWLWDFRDLPPVKRWRRLVAELRAWPTPKHQDDKTIAVLSVLAAK